MLGSKTLESDMIRRDFIGASVSRRLMSKLLQILRGLIVTTTLTFGVVFALEPRIPDCMPDLWQWEENESPQLKALRDEPPMDPEALIDLATKIRTYLNQMCQLNLSLLEF